MIKVSFIFLIVFSITSYASWNVVPDQTIIINAEYDQETEQFYDVNASGSDLIEISIIDGNQIKIKHGRDGYKNVVIPERTEHRFARNTTAENRLHTLVGRSTNEIINLDVGRGNSRIFGVPTTAVGGAHDGSGCKTTDTWTQHFTHYEVFHTKTNSVYQSDWCLGRNARSTQYAATTLPNNGGQIGYIERYFRFPLNSMNKIPFDAYVGTYHSLPTADVLREGNSNLGREAYRYIITVNIKPSVNIFTVDNENISFSVNKNNNQIIGKAQTGFNIKGSFHNSQAFDMTFTSLNNALCSGALCLSNTNSSSQIPYQVSVLDPSTLQEKAVSQSGQKATIYADKDFQLSSGLYFSFDNKNKTLSGTFSDTLTIRAELKIM
ncbi:hypothetical protein VYI99_08765 [Vibrio cholerae]|uniref:hypothetical protein n=1 Tax=Vibrio cholerae TaxID=666 RepID=UPI002E346878|nr:hypothetical protein [Vibrio cholerae]MED7816346.1 hypothetical protein [Vibrio cholerae]